MLHHEYCCETQNPLRKQWITCWFHANLISRIKTDCLMKPNRKHANGTSIKLHFHSSMLFAQKSHEIPKFWGLKLWFSGLESTHETYRNQQSTSSIDRFRITGNRLPKYSHPRLENIKNGLKSSILIFYLLQRRWVVHNHWTNAASSYALNFLVFFESPVVRTASICSGIFTPTLRM